MPLNHVNDSYSANDNQFQRSSQKSFELSSFPLATLRMNLCEFTNSDIRLTVFFFGLFWLSTFATQSVIYVFPVFPRSNWIAEEKVHSDRPDGSKSVRARAWKIRKRQFLPSISSHYKARHRFNICEQEISLNLIDCANCGRAQPLSIFTVRNKRYKLSAEGRNSFVCLLRNKTQNGALTFGYVSVICADFCRIDVYFYPHNS